MSHPQHQSIRQSFFEIDEILRQYDTYILALARRTMSRNVQFSQILDLDIDELAQRVRIKFWRALEKRQVMNHKMYIRQIVHHEFISMLRQNKPTYPLPIDEHGELLPNVLQNSWLVSQDEDPYIMVAQQETFTEYLTGIAQRVIALPPQQREAMVCVLRDKVDDHLQLCNIFKAQNFPIERIYWPLEKRALHTLKSSLSPARRNLTILRDPSFFSKPTKHLA